MEDEITYEEALLRIDALKAKNYEAYRMVEIAKQMMYERGDAVQRVRDFRQLLMDDGRDDSFVRAEWVIKKLAEALDGEHE